jgi:hypothetical protein
MFNRNMGTEKQRLKPEVNQALQKSSQIDSTENFDHDHHLHPIHCPRNRTPPKQPVNGQYRPVTVLGTATTQYALG